MKLIQITRGRQYSYVRPFTLYVCLSVNVYLGVPRIPRVAQSWGGNLLSGCDTKVVPNATRYATHCSLIHDILIEWLRFLRCINKLTPKGWDAARIPCSGAYETQTEWIPFSRLLSGSSSAI